MMMVVPCGWLGTREKSEKTMYTLAAVDPVGLWTAAAAPLIVY